MALIQVSIFYIGLLSVMWKIYRWVIQGHYGPLVLHMCMDLIV